MLQHVAHRSENAVLDRNGTLIAPKGRPAAGPGADLSGVGRIRRILGGETLDGLDPRDRYESPFGSGPVVGAGKTIPKLGWAVLTEWPIRDADSVILDIRNQVITFTLFGILAVLLLAPFFAIRFLKPVRALQASAAEIEEGKFDREVVIKTGDELEDLGRAFNQMTKGLRRLRELQEEFVFVAAHELRTPVTAIKGYISFLLDESMAGVLPSKAKEFLGQVERANARLVQLVNDLLEVARSEADRLKIEVKPVDLAAPIRAVLDELAPLAAEKNISIRYEPPAGLARVLADEGRVKEIMVNLVGNAIKYNRPSGSVSVRHETQDRELITHVADTGIGIPKEAQARLFEKFYRVQSDAARDITGTGLGIFIVKEIVEKMGGKSLGESEEGRGSTFSFSLPRA